MNKNLDFIVDLRGEVLRNGGEGGIGPGIWSAVPTDEPVGNVDVGFVVFRFPVFDQGVRYGVGEALQLGEFLVSGFVAVNVRECGDGTAHQKYDLLCLRHQIINLIRPIFYLSKKLMIGTVFTKSFCVSYLYVPTCRTTLPAGTFIT